MTIEAVHLKGCIDSMHDCNASGSAGVAPGWSPSRHAMLTHPYSSINSVADATFLLRADWLKA